MTRIDPPFVGRAFGRVRALVAVGIVGVAASVVTNAAADTAATSHTFAFQPITIQRINLPSTVSEARWSGFASERTVGHRSAGQRGPVPHVRTGEQSEAVQLRGSGDAIP